jgi:hypothetical protein
MRRVPGPGGMLYVAAVEAVAVLAAVVGNPLLWAVALVLMLPGGIVVCPLLYAAGIAISAAGLGLGLPVAGYLLAACLVALPAVSGLLNLCLATTVWRTLNPMRERCRFLASPA